jgi:hypothetical protein
MVSAAVTVQRGMPGSTITLSKSQSKRMAKIRYEIEKTEFERHG